MRGLPPKTKGELEGLRACTQSVPPPRQGEVVYMDLSHQPLHLPVPVHPHPHGQILQEHEDCAAAKSTSSLATHQSNPLEPFHRTLWYLIRNLRAEGEDNWVS